MLRAARAHPAASAAELASRVRCHPSTVTRHLTGLRQRQRRRGLRPAQVVLAGSDTAPQDRALLRAGGTLHAVTALREASLMAMAARQDENEASLSAFADNPDPLLRAAVAANRTCPPYLLKSLALAHLDSESLGWVRAAAVAHPACPEGVRALAADSGFWPEVAAQGAELAAALRARLAFSSDWGARRAVAAHPDCDPRLLVRLARDAHPAVRLTVAARERCPPRLLDRLAHDPHEAVRTAAAARKTQPAPRMSHKPDP